MRRISSPIVGIAVTMFWTALSISSWGSLSGCGTSLRSEVSSDSRALEIWRHHEAVVDRAIKGYQNEDEFIESCLFFLRLTGIDIDVNMSTVGFIPQAEAPKDLKRIRAWYKQNHSRLYWDEKTRTVQVRNSE